MVEDPPFIGDWHRSTKLGSGGFGVVWMWQNSKTKEKIAVKKCHISVGLSPNVDKQRERCEREVDLMTNQVRHLNIVRGIKVNPETFLTELNKFNQSGMPILLMEYCEGGDLRSQLNNSKNCTGLLESEVRNVLQALKNAVYYLHSMKITHRDIKPENVVIHIAPDGRNIYKLTDLGYAKPLDLKSIEASLVGTIEYIAPEFITNQKYSCSIDYWSLGIIGYEVITGFRPFLPHLSIAQWMLRVRDKKSEHISILEDDDGNIIYCDKILPENQISMALNNCLRDWFRLALEWNPKQRGCTFEQPNESLRKSVSDISTENGTCMAKAPVLILKFFNKLDEILSKKFLTMFVLTNNQHISMEVDENTTNEELYGFIERNTQIPNSKCHIIIPLENMNTEIGKIGHFEKPLDLYFDGCFDKPMIFINMISAIDSAKKGSGLDESSIVIELPTIACNVLRNPERKLKLHTLKRFTCEALHFIRTENERYKTCLNGWFNYALQLNHDIELCRTDVNKMNSLIYGLNGALELYGETIKENKTIMDEKFATSTNHFHLGYMEQHRKLSINIQLLVDACEKIVVRYQSVYRRSRDAYQSECLEKRNVQDFYDIVNTTKAFNAVRMQIVNKSFTEKPHFELFQCIYKCLKHRDQLLRNTEFIELQKNLNCIHVELNEIKKAIDKAMGAARQYKNELFKLNKILHTNLWSMISAVETSAITNNEQLSSNSLNPYCLSSLSQSYGNDSIDFKIGACVRTDITDEQGNRIFCFGEGNDTRRLIDDNEQLRISIDGLMQEMEEEFGSAELSAEKMLSLM